MLNIEEDAFDRPREPVPDDGVVAEPFDPALGRGVSEQGSVVVVEGEAVGVLYLGQLVHCQSGSEGEPCALQDLEGAVGDRSHSVAVL
ncbi:hypothetical protein [Promicromonospora sp. NPDC050880]|uniref:hypothetical protein n=1 Tax=Promicromonospora sp. NPDC050880 TaxID=3364406 RepID=UPI0037A2D0B9